MGILTSDTSDVRLAKKISSKGLLSKDEIKRAQDTAKNLHIPLSHLLLRDSTFNPETLLEVVAEHYDAPFIHLKDRIISPYVLALIPKEIAEEHVIAIFKKKGEEIHVATAAPQNQYAIDFIEKRTGLTPKVFIATAGHIESALKLYQSNLEEEFARIIEQSTKQALTVHESAEKMAQFVPIIKIIDTLIERALSQHASDIHIEAGIKTVIVRFRVDGLLTKIVELPKEILPALRTRVKILSQLKIDEQRLPQDGRINFTYRERDIAIRVSIIPTLQGGTIVLRLLDTQKQMFTLRALGFNDFDLKKIKKEITNQQGIILVTGPTGSGKTTTLYTMLRLLNKEAQNICTVEDPIEYGIEGINQTQINTQVGLTFARGLRSLLRQDPNILMVGEIRDRETAEMAFNAAMTGHLVLTTLHTNNAFLAPQRLIEMGVEPFLVASVTTMMMAQRLLRTICKHCKSTVRSSPKVLDTYRDKLNLDFVVKKLKSNNLLSPSFALENVKFYYGRGCEKCNNTGYRGRSGVYEVLDFDENTGHQILRDNTSDAVKKEAMKRKITTMQEDGILKVFEGKTTFEELIRVTQE